ncbi:hypothetical protein [Filomicrobium sp.]|uniref:hypothetical protein n=1 Tax=Filomicrobium sp. TaxID=2024831 RepID=UPI00258A69FB|nr:hypothetical protein [Filomicrobium sp.]MCV0370209.1 hypothetical protein [Filomicrobium sp.]
MRIYPFLLDLAKIVWGNGWSKTGSLLAAAGASALLGWLDQLVGFVLGIDIRQPPEWASILVMFSGIGLLVWGNSRPSPPPARPAPNPHDVQLMNRFRQLITEQVIDFLRNHNFGTPWKRSRLDALAEFAETWRGGRFEFNDPELNTALSLTKASANAVEGLIAIGSWPDRKNAEIQTVKTDEDYRIGTQKATLDKIDEMNAAATNLVRDIDALERIAQGKLV